jgi:Rrf2 family protein
MLTNKAKYGLKALVYLTRNTDSESVLLVDIAAANNIPRKFLHAILRELRNSGYVKSKKGPGGGYALAPLGRNIKVGDIVRALDGPLAPIGCASRNHYQPCEDCKDVNCCRVRLAMLKVRDAMAAVLDSMTLEDMANLCPEDGTDLGVTHSNESFGALAL